MAEEISQPNKNLFPLETAENGIRSAVNALCGMSCLNAEQTEAQGHCVTALLEFQSGPLLELRRAVE